MDRRAFLRLLLATAAAEAVDFEQLLWVPKPIVVVPALPGTYGSIIRSTYPFWRNQGIVYEARFLEDAMRAFLDKCQ